MPQKSLSARAAKARKQGTTVTVKASDVRDVGALSNHAAKKSRAVMARQTLKERSVSPKEPPGESTSRTLNKLPLPDRAGSSTSRRKTLPTQAAAGYRKDGTPKHPSSHGRMSVRSTVRGRKKGVSQMYVKRAGGPHDRSPLHGG